MKRAVVKTFKIGFHHERSMWKDDTACITSHTACITSHTSNEIMAKNQNTTNITKHATCKTFLYCILIKATSDEF